MNKEYIFYNCTVYEKDNKMISGWDPSLFVNRAECMLYFREKYGKDFLHPVYELSRVKVGKGWEIIQSERIEEKNERY